MKFRNYITVLMSLLLVLSFAETSDANSPNPFQAANKKLARIGQRPAVDGRARFSKLFCRKLELDGRKLGYKKSCKAYIRDAKLIGKTKQPTKQSPIKIRIAMIGGIFSDCVREKISMFSNARPYVQSAKSNFINSMSFKYIRVSGYSSSKENAKLISSAIGKMNIGKTERLVVVSYSKGTSDLIEALASYPKLGKKIDAVLSVAGVVLGSPLAENKGVFEKFFKSFKTGCRGPDGEGLQSITTVNRQKFLKKNNLPERVKYYSLVGNVSKARTSLILRPLRKLLALRGVNDSDAQVPTSNAVLPGSSVLGYMNADHWAIAMPFEKSFPLLTKTFINRNIFPREIMLSSAIEVIASDLSR
ncbi:MAG: hypothetical protein QM488_05060 [Rhizobiaceae bacterium]